MNNTAKKVESKEQPKASLEVVKKDEKAVIEVPSLEKRIQKVEDLSMLIEKWRKLTETRRNLQTFSLGADGMGATVFLRDASGKEFKTSNTPVVSAVMDEIKTTLDEKIKEVEDQIKFWKLGGILPLFFVVDKMCSLLTPKNLLLIKVY